MKVAVAQIGSDPGCFEANINKVLSSIESAKKQGVTLIVFPEGCITSYLHLDLIYRTEYLDQTKTALQKVAQAAKGITVVIGFVDRVSDNLGPGNKPILSNSAALLKDGEIIAIRDKTLLPEYDIFSEHRYYWPGTRVGLLELDGLKFGIGICEDMWAKGYLEDVYPRMISAGADFLINLSASPYSRGKFEKRIKVIKELLGQQQIPLLYANCVGAYDGYDGEILFDGRSLIFNKDGELAAVGKAFSEDLLIVDLENAPAVTEEKLGDSEEMFSALVLGVREYFRRGRFKRAYVGLSGGIDSALVASLCVEALGSENVIGVTMPSRITSRETLEDAQALAKNLKIRCDVRPIANEYDTWLVEAHRVHGKDLTSLSKQNKQARIRGSIMMEYVNQDSGGLVITTGNKTEMALGYCTLYGDMCGALAPISDVSKKQVYELALYFNQLSGSNLILESIIKRPPTAELEFGQTDAANLPADYDVISPLVDQIIERRVSDADLIKQYGAQIVQQTKKLIRINEFKRRQAAPGIKVTRKAFGVGRRIPMMYGDF